MLQEGGALSLTWVLGARLLEPSPLPAPQGPGRLSEVCKAATRYSPGLSTLISWICRLLQTPPLLGKRSQFHEAILPRGAAACYDDHALLPPAGTEHAKKACPALRLPSRPLSPDCRGTPLRFATLSLPPSRRRPRPRPRQGGRQGRAPRPTRSRPPPSRGAAGPAAPLGPARGTKGRSAPQPPPA